MMRQGGWMAAFGKRPEDLAPAATIARAALLMSALGWLASSGGAGKAQNRCFLDATLPHGSLDPL